MDMHFLPARLIIKHIYMSNLMELDGTVSLYFFFNTHIMQYYIFSTSNHQGGRFS